MSAESLLKEVETLKKMVRLERRRMTGEVKKAQKLYVTAYDAVMASEEHLVTPEVQHGLDRAKDTLQGILRMQSAFLQKWSTWF